VRLGEDRASHRLASTVQQATAETTDRGYMTLSNCGTSIDDLQRANEL